MHVTCAASYNIHIMPKSQHHNMHKLLCLCTRREQTRENQIRGEIIQFYLCVVCVWFHLTEDICMSGLMQSTRHYFYRIGPLVYINVEGNTIAKMSWKILITITILTSMSCHLPGCTFFWIGLWETREVKEFSPIREKTQHLATGYSFSHTCGLVKVLRFKHTKEAILTQCGWFCRD